MATPMTLKKEKFKNLIENFSDEKIIPLPCPGLVELIEQGKKDSSETEDFLNKLLSPYFEKNIDSVVLGCTHYPFVKETVKKVFPYEVKIFDGGYGTACETKRRIRGMENNPSHKGEVTFLNSKDGDFEIELCKTLLKKI